MTLIQPLVSAVEKCLSGMPSAGNLYSRPYRRVVAKEIELARITSADRVLNIGCGAVPFTAIHVSRLTGAKVWALDRDPGSVNKARAYIKNAGLMERIEVLECDGAEVMPVDFDVAIVALQACPKERILRNLLEAVRPEGRLVFRQPSPRFTNHYDKLPQHILPNAEVKHDMKTFDRSLLLVKPLNGEGDKR